MLLVFAILLIIILVVLVRCIVIVPQSNAYVTEWLGVYKDTWGAGLHIRTPFVERISRKVSLKEEAADFPPQPVITRDNVTMMIDTVVFFQVFDAKMYAYGVNRPIQAIENLSATTLRDIIGSMFFSSTRLTLMPQWSVASSRLAVIFVLMRSRLVRVSSSVIEPMMSRSVVADRFSMAWIGRFTP